MDIYFILYTYNGLGNQLASLQLLAGLAAAMPDQEIKAVYCKLSFGKKWAIQDPQDYQVDTSKWDGFFDSTSPRLLDMLDYKLPSNVTLLPDDRAITNRINSNIINCQSHVYVPPGTPDEVLKEFTSLRTPITFSETKNNILTLTLKWYSTFFVNRSTAIDKELAKIKFNSEYTELVARIKKDVGLFTGAHVRIMPDHHSVYTFTDDAYKSGLASVSRPGTPLLLSIDDWNHPYIEQYSKSTVLVHDLILNEYRSDFLSMSHHNRIDLATLSMLLMIESDDFIGTYPSTYTGYIQQQRAQRDAEDWKFFDVATQRPYNKNYAPYSWYSTPDGPVMTWERDFQECKLNLD